MDEGAAFCSRCGQPTGVAPVPRVTPRRRLSRPMYDKKIAGVCAGFARYFGMDVTLMRVLWLIVALGTGIFFIVYIVAWIAMPRDYEPVATTVVQRA
jgi:phage shock protein C